MRLVTHEIAKQHQEIDSCWRCSPVNIHATRDCYLKLITRTNRGTAIWTLKGEN